MTATFVGVSGFSYPGWKGKFYPKETKSEEFLPYYSNKLSSVEINSSFYAQPTSSMVKGWAGKTATEFVFSFKSPKQITHVAKLGDESIEQVERMSKTLDLLGPRRGPILFQLPPFSKQNLDVLREFLFKTRGVKKRVFEFRHESWFQDATFTLLEDEGVGHCIVDSEDFATKLKVTSGLAYFRLRKESYDQGSIDAWAKKIAEVTKGVGERYVYLRHDETGENAILAQSLARALSA